MEPKQSKVVVWRCLAKRVVFPDKINGPILGLEAGFQTTSDTMLCCKQKRQDIHVESGLYLLHKRSMTRVHRGTLNYTSRYMWVVRSRDLIFGSTIPRPKLWCPLKNEVNKLLHFKFQRAESKRSV